LSVITRAVQQIAAGPPQGSELREVRPDHAARLGDGARRLNARIALGEIRLGKHVG
jgi:hypothetical protein